MSARSFKMLLEDRMYTYITVPVKTFKGIYYPHMLLLLLIKYTYQLNRLYITTNLLYFRRECTIKYYHLVAKIYQSKVIISSFKYFF